MKLFQATFFYILLLSSTMAFPVTKRDASIRCKTSVIVPCHVGHMGYLYNLLECYAMQTVLPDEVVIAISGVKRNEPINDTRILSHPWPFITQFLITENRYSASGNRNRASECATGDILIYQDADDIPHYRRIEVIKFFFENYEISYLSHHHVFERGEFRDFADCSSLDWYVPRSYSPRIGTNPAVTITKAVFEKIKWPELPHGEDSAFGSQVYDSFPDRITVMFPLYKYFRRNPNHNDTQPQHEVCK